MVFPKLHVDSSACVTTEASLLTSDGETWQLLRKENDIVVIRLSGDGGILSLFLLSLFTFTRCVRKVIVQGRHYVTFQSSCLIF